MMFRQRVEAFIQRLTQEAAKESMREITDFFRILN
jgi:hypothetical protein